MSSDQVYVLFDFEGVKADAMVENGENLHIMISSITNNEPFCICYKENGKDKVFYPFGINLVAKISDQNSSKASLYYQNEEIFQSSDLNLKIKAKKFQFDNNSFGPSFAKESVRKLLTPSFKSFFILILDKTKENELIHSKAVSVTSWKISVRNMLNEDVDLFFIDPNTGKYVKVYLDANDLKSKKGEKLLNSDSDNKAYRVDDLLFLDSPEGVSDVEDYKIGNETFKVVKLLTLSKFVLKNPNTLAKSSHNALHVSKSTVEKAFQANFNQLKLNSVDYIRANAKVYSFIYRNNGKFYVPMASLCQCSGSGKSKSSTTVIKRTPGFYVCVRKKKGEYAVPESNTFTDDLLAIFGADYIVDSLEDQSNLNFQGCTVGRCLGFVARMVKSYIVAVTQSLAEKLNVTNETDSSLEEKLLETLDKFSSEHFETSKPHFETFSAAQIENDIKQKDKRYVVVSDVVNYIELILDKPENCFKLDSELADKFEKDARLQRACNALSKKIDSSNPFLFFVDEAGELAKMKGYEISSLKDSSGGQYSALQIFRRALSYLDLNTNIFFLALGTKSTIEKLSPPIIDNSTRAVSRKNFFPPIVMVQDFDIWREIYPLDEFVPCFNTLLNCCTVKLLATLGHPLFSSLKFDEIVKLAETKILNGTSTTTKTYLLAIWMLRAGLTCDPKSVLAEALVENHMATIFNIRRPSNGSDGQEDSSDASLTFANQGQASYDITYQSTPCLALGAREATKHLSTEEKFEFFQQLELKTESMVVDRGKLGEATGTLLSALLIDKITKNEASTELNTKTIKEMKRLTPEKFHSLWDKTSSLLYSDPSKPVQKIVYYKVVTVESYLRELMGPEAFNDIKDALPSTTLRGLINATHFVALSRIGGSTELVNANDLVGDKTRNVITWDRLRLALARQCGILMPANYYGIDACMPVCLPTVEVIGPDGLVTIEDATEVKGNSNCIPYSIYDPTKHAGKSRYRPMYTFLGIQYKSGKFDIDAVPKMQARHHFVPCSKPHTSTDPRCSDCISQEALEEVFDNQISLLYCFLSREGTSRKKLIVNYGRELGNNDWQPAVLGIDEIFQKLYPSLTSQNNTRFKPNSDLTIYESTKSQRTFQDFFLCHRKDISKSVELITTFYDDNHGCTYRSSDVSKWESYLSTLQSNKRRRETVESNPASNLASELGNLEINASPDSEITSANPEITSSDNSEITSSVNPEITPVNPGTSVAPETTQQDGKIEPVRPLSPFNRGRMSTVIVYGWEPWEAVIGQKGVAMADKLFHEFDLNPLRNIEESDLKGLKGSLKIIMSSKLVGADRYLEPKNTQNDIPYCSLDEWIVFLHQKFEKLVTPHWNPDYCAAEKRIEANTKKMDVDS